MAVTEPDAGSDVKAIRTRARREGGDWVLNGSKMFITNGVHADLYFVAARTDPEAKGARAVSMFIVEKGTPGLRVGRALKKSGWLCSDTAELVFEDCRVPEENLLGGENDGFYAIMKNFQTERIALAAMAVGHALTALDLTLDYVKQRKAFGGVLFEKQAIRQRLAMLQAKTEAARQFMYHCAWLVTQKRRLRARSVDAQGADRRAGQRGRVQLPAVPRRYGLHAREPDRAPHARRARAGHRRRRDRGDARRGGQALMSEAGDASMNQDAVRLAIDDRGVATLTLNRPDVHNAFDDQLIANLTHKLRELAHNHDVRVVVMAANGKSFSAGADLNWMERMARYSEAENLRDAVALADLMHTLSALPKPTVARVQGAAFGGGVGLVACCDVAVGSPAASFSLSEVRLGLIPAVISPHVIAAIGERQARRYFLTAERFDAAEALRIGLLHVLVEEQQLDAAVQGIVDQLLKAGPKSLAAAKSLIASVVNRPIDRALVEDTAERIARIRVGAEGREGIAAFLEKRAPSWTKKSQ